MKKIGITGGIGSGKSTVCKVLESLNIPVYYADDEAKRLMENDALLVQQIKNLFGNSIYEEGKLNREKLASIVFFDKLKLAQLNAHVHPAVAKHSEEWMQQQNAPYIVKEAALLFETGTYKLLDFIITVVAEKEERTERIIKRDNTTAEAIAARMDKQWNDEEKIKLSHFIIYNNKKNLILPQILDIHHQLVS